MLRLRREPESGVVLGVCSGMAKTVRLEPSLVRLAFVVLALAGGLGIGLYLVLGLVVPVEGSQANGPADWIRENMRLLPRTLQSHQRGLGVVLLVSGVLILASQHGLLSWITWDRTWPVLLVLGGAALLFAKGAGGPGAT